MLLLLHNSQRRLFFIAYSIGCAGLLQFGGFSSQGGIAEMKSKILKEFPSCGWMLFRRPACEKGQDGRKTRTAEEINHRRGTHCFTSEPRLGVLPDIHFEVHDEGGTILRYFGGYYYYYYREMILSLRDAHLVTVNSLKNTVKRDAEDGRQKLKSQPALKSSPMSNAWDYT